jgi:hypothetical protein
LSNIDDNNELNSGQINKSKCMTDNNSITMQDFLLKNQGITYFSFESITHRLILRFDSAESLLELNSININDDHKQTFVIAGDTVKYLMIEHREDTNTVIIVDPKELKEIIHFKYVSYFKYNPVRNSETS